MAALPSRESLAAVFAPLPDRADLTAQLAQEQLTAVLDGTDPAWNRAAIRALFAGAREAEHGTFPDDEEVARFGMALMSFPVRDALWLAVDSGHLAGSQLWINLARRLPGDRCGGDRPRLVCASGRPSYGLWAHTVKRIVCIVMCRPAPRRPAPPAPLLRVHEDVRDPDLLAPAPLILDHRCGVAAQQHERVGSDQLARIGACGLLGAWRHVIADREQVHREHDLACPRAGRRADLGNRLGQGLGLP
jgi:hypothetical protein